MVDIAMTALVVVVADHAGGIGRTGMALGDGVVDRGLQGQTFSVCLSGSIVAVAKTAGVAGKPTVQGIDIGLRT